MHSANKSDTNATNQATAKVHDLTTILILDSSAPDREACIQGLSANPTKYKFLEATSWDDAKVIFETTLPDCVLLEYALPDVDGLEILNILSHQHPALPIIMFTNQGSESIAVKAIKNGAQNYLVKSEASIDHLHNEIQNAIEQKALDFNQVDKDQSLLEAEVKLQAAKHFQSIVIQSIPDLVFVKDEAFRIVEANAAFLNVYPEEERDQVIGKSSIEDFEEEEAEAFIAQDRIAFETGSSETEETIFFPDQKKRTLHTKKVRFDGLDGKKYIIGIGRDITAYKEALDELLRSNVELQRFAYVASHDLKEPLRMVTQFTKRLEKKYANTFDEQGQQYLDFITNGAIRMQALVEDLLNYARLDQKVDHNEKINVSILIDTVLENLDELVRESNARIILGKLPDVVANPVRLTSLLQNIISNSLKYQDSGNQATVEVAIEQKDKFWQFAVKDNGIGFKQEYAEKIFEPFKRLHAQNQYTGTGIGLAISRKIVEELGGKIWAESIESQGSTFFFTIPLKPQENQNKKEQ